MKKTEDKSTAIKKRKIIQTHTFSATTSDETEMTSFLPTAGASTTLPLELELDACGFGIDTGVACGVGVGGSGGGGGTDGGAGRAGGGDTGSPAWAPYTLRRMAAAASGPMISASSSANSGGTEYLPSGVDGALADMWPLTMRG